MGKNVSSIDPHHDNYCKHKYFHILKFAETTGVPGWNFETSKTSLDFVLGFVRQTDIAANLQYYFLLKSE